MDDEDRKAAHLKENADYAERLSLNDMHVTNMPHPARVSMFMHVMSRIKQAFKDIYWLAFKQGDGR